MFCRIKPTATAKMEAAFAQCYDAKKEKTGRVFTPINLFDKEQKETQSFHFVFVLDESVSMEPHWNSLQTAYQGFLTRRNDDHFTVVLFDDNAHTIGQHQNSLSNTPKNLPDFNKGGTIYSAGLREAKKAIANDKTESSIVMIFMSDGGNNGGDGPVELIHQFKNTYGKDHNFICHTVGFGEDVAPGSEAAQLLAEMASTGDGQTYSAKNGVQLNNVFGSIAANSTTSDALVERFSEILAREISVKIMVDYF